MDEPRVGQQVITSAGVGIVTTIPSGSADSDICRYRITHDGRHRWHYLDEIITIEMSVER